MPPPPHLITSLGFTVASWDVDPRNRLHTSAIGRFLQEAAAANATGLGLGHGDLVRLGQTWVLTNLRLEAARLPGYGEVVTVTTWPRDIAGRRALRDFELEDRRGAFAAAASAWMCLDLQSRRPVSPEHWRQVPWLPERRALTVDLARLPALTGQEFETALPVRWTDLDLNGHVTNTRYQDLLLESYAPDWLADHAITAIELAFLAEGRYPDTLRSRREEHPDRPATWRHALTRAADGVDICRAAITWT